MPVLSTTFLLVIFYAMLTSLPTIFQKLLLNSAVKLPSKTFKFINDFYPHFYYCFIASKEESGFWDKITSKVSQNRRENTVIVLTLQH